MLDTAKRLVHFRGLVSTLTARELKARYRGSALGFFWSLVNPLLLLAVYTLVFGFIFVPGERAGGMEPYALFLVTGLFPWMWVSGSLLDGTMSLIANAGLIRKAVFPAEVLPLVSVLSHGVHFLLALPILAAALVAGRLLGYPVSGWTAVLLPAICLVQLPMLAGLALALAALNVHFKDVRDLTANVLTLLFFLTPILYPLSAISNRWLQLILQLNPFTPFTLAYQQALFFRQVPSPGLWLLMVAWSLAAWALGTFLFGRLRDTLVEAV